jgi:amino acid transporter
MADGTSSGTRPGPAGLDPDHARLLDLGYEQELRRGLRGFENVAMGFAAISPVVALYGVVLVGTGLAGPAWVWMLPLALAGQCLFLVVYAELASQFPVANSTYQWSRRLLGPAYGWFNGWVGLCAYAVANTTIAYLGAPWALILVGRPVTAHAIVVTGAVLVGFCAVVNALGLDALKLAVKLGIAAEVVASVGVGLALLLGHREQPVSVLGETFGAQARSGGSVTLALLAALAVGGWVFIGFDACGLTSEETTAADRQVPRAVWVALLTVGAIVVLDATAIMLAHPRIEDAVSGQDLDPVTTAVVSAFGDWSARPFAGVTLVAFLACGLAAQGITARAIWSVARDKVLPASGFLAGVSRRQVPLGATVLTAVVAWAGLLLGLDAAAIGSLITFGTVGIYVAFLLLATAALVARTTGRWRPSGTVRLGRLGLVCNVLAVGWLAFETVNIAWPRETIAPPGAPWYQVWAAALVLGVITVIGAGYLAVARPHRRVPRLPGSAERSEPVLPGPRSH